MDFTGFIKNWLNRSELAAGVGLVGLMILSVATMADVIMRAVFSDPIYGLSDLIEIVTPPIVASCLPVALAARQNITIRFLGRALPSRMGQGVELFGQLAVLCVVTGIAWQVSAYAWNMYDHGQVTWLLHLPAWPSWFLTSLLIVACVPIQLLVVAETVSNMRAGKPLADEHPELEEAR
ncbi:TRAP transporter small permease [Chachezhania antarctica]|uniref:TRAP transporter small permease n=1 Tax=Chachezhania antarctica TaxID=2340860 RepID=UPI000EB168D7|nr:TRAP transporter small permease subunit [Chachezhania antarctica]|tara:strand:+ start:583 stop:1119 length:537 start_codon:yes stop_codon:yes gene_type:complete